MIRRYSPSTSSQKPASTSKPPKDAVSAFVRLRWSSCLRGEPVNSVVLRCLYSRCCSTLLRLKTTISTAATRTPNSNSHDRHRRDPPGAVTAIGPRPRRPRVRSPSMRPAAAWRPRRETASGTADTRDRSPVRRRSRRPSATPRRRGRSTGRRQRAHTATDRPAARATPGGKPRERQRGDEGEERPVEADPIDDVRHGAERDRPILRQKGR